MHFPHGSEEDLDLLIPEAIAAGDPNRCIDNSWPTYLAAAMIQGRFDLARDLIDAGAKPNIKDVANALPHAGASFTLEFFASSVVVTKQNLTDFLRRSLLSSWGNGNCSELLARGADPNFTITASKTVDGRLQEVTTTGLHVAVYDRQPTIVRALLQSGAKVDALDSDGLTPLQKACQLLRVKYLYDRLFTIETILWLLEYGSDPNHLTPTEYSPLHWVSVGWREEIDYQFELHSAKAAIAGLLLRYGGDPNALTPEGTTALMLAAKDNNPRLTAVLLRNGADRDIRSPNRKTALDVAIERGSEEVAVLLR